MEENRKDPFQFIGFLLISIILMFWFYSSRNIPEIVENDLEVIEKTILDSNLGVNPQTDGNNILLKFPELTAERRKELAKIISESILQVNKDLIFLVPTESQMEKAGTKLGIKIATEIFADRNYEDDGNLVSRSKDHALITDPNMAKKHVLSMVKNQALNCFSGKQIPCEIDSVCIHGDNESSLATAKSIKKNLVSNGLILKPLNKMEKFS